MFNKSVVIVIVIVIDLKKALIDTSDHGILLRKLYSYGIRGSMLKWMESYLTYRSQVYSCFVHIWFDHINFTPFSIGVNGHSCFGHIVIKVLATIPVLAKCNNSNSRSMNAL